MSSAARPMSACSMGGTVEISDELANELLAELSGHEPLQTRATTRLWRCGKCFDRWPCVAKQLHDDLTEAMGL